MVFDNPEFDDHERVTFLNDATFGLEASNVTHRTRHGMAGGGIRMRPYSTTEDTLTDALRLSRTMTYKFALAHLPAGVAKTVIIGNPEFEKTSDLLKSLGRYIESLHGAYLGGPDVGTNGDGVEIIGEETSYLAGRTDDPGSTATPNALGVFNDMRAVAKFTFGTEDLDGVKVSVRGAGGVGSRVCDLLAHAGARVLVTDMDAETATAVAAQTGADVMDAQDVLFADVDILSPCALGGVLNEQSIPRLKARAICAVGRPTIN